LQPLDEAFQELLCLSHGRNSRASYKKWLKIIRALVPQITADLALRSGVNKANTSSTSSTEMMIIETLKEIIPSASLSFQQALLDLSDTSRVSLRGTAVELRETLREVLDHFAPDAGVMKAPGFKLEKDRHGRDRDGPTMRQKVHFILKARERSKAAMATPEDAAETVERGVAELARSTYTLGSVAGNRTDVLKLKRYVEVVLLDLLEL
jgi:Predicted pPIWI-associating nuclease